MREATKPFHRSQQCSDLQKENICRIPPRTCSLSPPNPIRATKEQEVPGNLNESAIRGQGSQLEPCLLQSMNTCLGSGHLAKPLLVAYSPHTTHDAARPSGNRQGPPGPAGVGGAFGHTPQVQGVPKKMINPRNAVSSSATVAHKKKTVRTLQWAGMKQEDALKTTECSLRTTARYVQRPPTVSNARPERRVRCATFSQRWQVAGLHRSAHRSSEPSVTTFTLVPLCSCMMRPC